VMFSIPASMSAKTFHRGGTEDTEKRKQITSANSASLR
jgi:hypothetical protein